MFLFFPPRSVRYIENSVLDTSNPRSSNLVVTNQEPYPFELPPPPPNQPTPDSSRPNNAAAVFANNARMSAASSSSAGAGAAAAIHEKNVNIDKFKLGEEEGQDEDLRDGACAVPGGGAASRHCYEEIDDDESADILPEEAATKSKEFDTDVNLYRDDEDGDDDDVAELSPSKERNNARLADLYYGSKAGNKPNVNLVINNTFEPSGYRVEEDEEEEEETDPKTFVVNMREEGGGGFGDGGNDDFAKN